MNLHTLRKAFASVSAAVLLLTAIIVPGMGISTAQAQAWYNPFFEVAHDLGITSGDLSSQASATMKRKDFAMFLVNAGLAGGLIFPEDLSSIHPFTDVPTAYAESVGTLYQLGVIKGVGPTTFGSEQTTFKEQQAKMVAILLGLVDPEEEGDVTATRFTDVSSDFWAAVYIGALLDNGYISGEAGSNTFGVGTVVNNATGAALIMKSLEITDASGELLDGVETVAVARGEVAGTTTTTGTTTGTTSGGGGGTLRITLAADTPATANIPMDAAAVRFTKVTFSASGGDVVANSVTVTRTGLGNSVDFDDVWMIDADNGLRVSRQRGLTAEDIALLTFSPPLALRSGESADMFIVAELAGTAQAGRQNAFAIASADAVSSSGTVTGSFPVVGNVQEIANYAIGELSFVINGTGRTIDVGTSAEEIGEFRLGDQSDANRNALVVQAISLEVNGSINASEELANFALYRAGTRVSEIVEQADGDDMVNLVMLPTQDNTGTEVPGYYLADGNTRVFTLRADLIGGSDGDTIQIQLNRGSDINAYVPGLGGYSPRVVAAFLGASVNNVPLNQFTVNAGDITISKDPSSGSVGLVAADSDDFQAMVMRVFINQPIEFKSISFNVNYTTPAGFATAAATLTAVNLRVDNHRLVLLDEEDAARLESQQVVSKDDMMLAVVNGRTLASEQAATVGAAANTAVVVFGDDFTLEAVNKTVLVAYVMDVNAAALAGDTIAVQYNGAAGVTAEYIGNSDTVAAGDITGGIATSSTFSVGAPTLTFNEVSGIPANNALVAGSRQALMGVFNVDNNDVEALTITDIVLQDQAPTAAAPAGLALLDMSVINNCFFAQRDAQGGVAIRGQNYNIVSEVEDFSDSNAAVAPTAAAATTGQATATYDQVAVTILPNQQASLYFFCDVATSAVTTQSLRLGITSVTAEDSDGTGATELFNNAQIAAGNPGFLVELNLSAGGNMVVSTDPSTTDTDLIVGDGSSNQQEVWVIKISGEDDELLLSDLRLVIADQTFANRINKAYLYKMDGSNLSLLDDSSVTTQQIGTAAGTAGTPAAANAGTTGGPIVGVLSFSIPAAVRLKIAKDSNSRVVVKLAFNDITQVAQNALRLQMHLDEGFLDVNAERSIEATSNSTGVDLVKGSIDIAGTLATVTSVAVAPIAVPAGGVAPCNAVVTVNFNCQIIYQVPVNHGFRVGERIVIADSTAVGGVTAPFLGDSPELADITAIGPGAVPATNDAITVTYLAAASAVGAGAAPLATDRLIHGNMITVVAVDPTTLIAPANVLSTNTIITLSGPSHAFSIGEVIAPVVAATGDTYAGAAALTVLAATNTTITVATANLPGGVIGGAVVGDYIPRVGTTEIALADDFLLFNSVPVVNTVDPADRVLGFGGTEELVRMSVAAHAAGDISWKRVTFSISQTDTNVSAFVLRGVAASGNVIQTPTLAGAPGSVGVANTISTSAVAHATPAVGAQVSTPAAAALQQYVVGSTVQVVLTAGCAASGNIVGDAYVGTVTAMAAAPTITITPATGLTVAGPVACIANEFTYFPFVGTVVAGGTAAAPQGGTVSSGLVTMVVPTEEEVSQGTTKRYELSGTTGDRGAQDFNSLSTQIVATGDALPAALANVISAAGVAALPVGSLAIDLLNVPSSALFIWSSQPNPAQHNETTSVDWHNGFLVDNFPTSSKTITN
ncbi:MAG: S-layer homology domain-containing protein [bacterium]|nr:S-layer homology domain-containing protein [bacterium]